MMTLYGGEDADRKGHYTDIWHIRVHAYNITEGEKAHVDYKRVNYEKQGSGHQILSWRKGFTLHYLKSQENPVMIGGNYGNRQESQIMLILPEVKCADQPQYKEGQCVPCPVGSIFDS